MTDDLHPRYSQVAAPGAGAPSGPIDPADANTCFEWAKTMRKLGFETVLVIIERCSELLERPAFGEALGAELQSAGLGHFDSDDLADNPRGYYFYLHADAFVAGIRTVKTRLDQLGLLSHCIIMISDAEAEVWRFFYPELRKAGA
jgi:hypothetical protein